MTALNKHLQHWLIGSIALVSSMLGHADPSPKDLHLLRMMVTDAVTSFYMYSGLDADDKYANRLDSNLSAINTHLVTIKASVDNDQTSQAMDKIVTNWNSFYNLTTENQSDIASLGYPNLRLLNDMGDACFQLVNQSSDLYQTLLVSDESKPTKAALLSRELAYQMANITAQYIARGTINLGQVFLGYHKQTPSEMADYFDELLLELTTVATTPKDQLEISNISSKWSFLRNSIDNYKENPVPFLVLNYNDSIISSLKKLDTDG